MIYLVCFLAGGSFFTWLLKRVIEPWARRSLGRHLECDHWGLPE